LLSLASGGDAFNSTGASSQALACRLLLDVHNELFVWLEWRRCSSAGLLKK
jgi:hypothetical protein